MFGRRAHDAGFTEKIRARAGKRTQGEARPFSLLGVEREGSIEHVASRPTHAAVLALARKLAPEIAFPVHPVARNG
jgi:hypothetical protein